MELGLKATHTGVDTVGPLHALLTESAPSVEQREASALRDLLREHRGRCVIFGGGTLGRKAVALLREIGVEALAVCDSNPAL